MYGIESYAPVLTIYEVQQGWQLTWRLFYDPFGQSLKHKPSDDSPRGISRCRFSITNLDDDIFEVLTYRDRGIYARLTLHRPVPVGTKVRIVCEVSLPLRRLSSFAYDHNVSVYSPANSVKLHRLSAQEENLRIAKVTSSS